MNTRPAYLKRAEAALKSMRSLTVMGLRDQRAALFAGQVAEGLLDSIVEACAYAIELKTVISPESLLAAINEARQHRDATVATGVINEAS